MKSTPARYVIVGSGIAGLSAAEALRELESRASITMISEEAHNFYSRPGLAYLLRGDVPEAPLFVRSRDDLRALNVDRITARVERLLCDQHEVFLGNGQRVRYDRLLLATGALAVPPPFPGGDFAGVVKLDSLEDARRIIKLARRGKSAVVIGGGITALELVEGLNARGMRVHYCIRGTRYWSDVLVEAESHIVMERLRREGVTIHTQTQIKHALGRDGRLAGVETQSGAQIPCQILAVAIGVRPRADLARQAGLKVGKGIAVNEFLQASVADVYAAGDTAEVFDSQSGSAALDVLWPTALAQGKAAGANMAGASRAYVKGIPLNVTMLAGLKVTVIGAIGGGTNDDLVAITRGESESWRKSSGGGVISAGDDANRVRLLVGERRIVGALVMGDQAWSRPIQRLILERADISSIRDALLGGSQASLGHLLQFYEQWKMGLRNGEITAAVA